MIEFGSADTVTDGHSHKVISLSDKVASFCIRFEPVVFISDVNNKVYLTLICLTFADFAAIFCFLFFIKIYFEV